MLIAGEEVGDTDCERLGQLLGVSRLPEHEERHERLLSNLLTVEDGVRDRDELFQLVEPPLGRVDAGKVE